MHQLAEGCTLVGNTLAQLVGIHVKVIKQAFNVAFRGCSLSRCFNGVKNGFQSLVQVLVLIGLFQNITEQLARQNEETLFLYKVILGLFRLFIRKFGVIKAFFFALVNVRGQVFGDIAVKKHSKNVLLKIPPIDRPTKVVCNSPNRTVQLCPFQFFLVICHIIWILRFYRWKYNLYLLVNVNLIPFLEQSSPFSPKQNWPGLLLNLFRSRFDNHGTNQERSTTVFHPSKVVGCFRQEKPVS